MREKATNLKMVCVGDVFPRNSETLAPTRSILKEADITFGQLENILSRRGTKQVFTNPPELNRQPGTPPPAAPLWIQGDPAEQLKVIVEAGFNVMSFAANHAYESSDEGIIDTIEVLNSNNIASVGASKNIYEATKPAVIEKKGQKIGFLAYCSVVPPGGWATHNKAGVAPLRAGTAYEQIDWQPGTPPRTISWCNKDDLAGMEDDIKNLKARVDVVVVSMHWGVKLIPGVIADYQFEAAHAAIDAGADLIIGHHAHILKGIEVYKGRVIFYSLGNFCCPPGKKITPVQASGLYWINRFGLRLQVDPQRPYYPYPIDSQKTILVKCAIHNNKIQRVTFLPLWINSQNQPEVLSHTDKRRGEHFQYMQWLCGSQGLDTKLSQEDDEVEVITQ